MKVKKPNFKEEYFKGRFDEREHIKKRVRKILENCTSIEEISDYIKNL